MRSMFSIVAPRYDFITRAFSYGMDKRWKRLLVDRASLPAKPVVLDLASGTGDFSLLVNQRYPGGRAVTADLTERMLHLARARGLQACRLQRCRPSSLRRRFLRLRFHRLRPAQFSRPRRGRARNRTRHAARRPAGEPGFFPARQCPDPPPLSGIPVCPGRVLGNRSAWPPARLYLHSRFPAELSFHR